MADKEKFMSYTKSSTGGKVVVRRPDLYQSSEGFKKESDHIGNQIEKTMKAKTPGDASFFKHTIKDN